VSLTSLAVRKPATSMTGTLGSAGSSSGRLTPSRRAAAGPAVQGGWKSWSSMDCVLNVGATAGWMQRREQRLRDILP